MGRSRYHFIDNYPHFITCTVVNWIPIFSRPEIAQIVLESLGFMQSKQRWILYGYVIMENHLHFIVSSATLSRAVGQFKSFTARSIIDWLIQHQFHSILKQLKAGKAVYKSDQKYQLWQEGSHPQAIFSPDVFRQKLEYIHNNPIRRGYVDEPGHWRYSSYRNYMGEEGLLSVQLLDV